MPFAGISLAYGLIVPSLFEWGEKPAFRSLYPEMLWLALIIFVLTLLIAVMIRFRGKPENRFDVIEGKEPLNRLQFNLRGLFLASTLLAILFVVVPMIDLPMAALMVSFTVGGVLVHSTSLNGSYRSRLGAWLVSLFFPFAWVILYNEPFGHASGLVTVLPAGPAIVPAMLLSGTPDESSGLAAAFVMVELWVGTWLAHRGGKLFFVCLVVVLLFSGFNSFVLHALYRM